jgi:hypothetical protein
MSTLTGTANFAQSSFPAAMQSYIAQLIGGVNLITAIMSGIYQFLKISENMESYRVASISYGKLSRYISTELSIPIKDREVSGAECVKNCRLELDELITKSPAIPQHVKDMYILEFNGKDIEEPENIKISPVVIYNDGEARITEVLKEFKKPLPDASSEKFSKTRLEKEIELEELKKSKLVSKSSDFLNEVLDSPRKFMKMFKKEPKTRFITYITPEYMDSLTSVVVDGAQEVPSSNVVQEVLLSNVIDEVPVDEVPVPVPSSNVIMEQETVSSLITKFETV